MSEKWEKLFVLFLVDVLTDKLVLCRYAFSTDLNVLTDKCGLQKFPVREKTSIERLRRMKLIVHRTHTKPEYNFPDGNYGDKWNADDADDTDFRRFISLSFYLTRLTEIPHFTLFFRATPVIPTEGRNPSHHHINM